ncbi:MAG: cell cycle transcriptional regulator TrcR [Pseudomonadota bacterium]
MNALPLMPKATAVWLVDNTSLTFSQIADFCGLHPLEVRGIADGEVAQGIKGQDPISSNQLTREEIKRGENDENHRLKLAKAKVTVPVVKSKKGPRYTPVSRRQDRPNAILWLLRSHPEMKDSQIMRLVGTTKPTITAIRDRTHWNSPNLQPLDPVTLGLCSQIDLDAEVSKANARAMKERAHDREPLEEAGTLLPIAETTEQPQPAEIVEAADLEPTPAPVSAEAAAADEEARMRAQLEQMGESDGDAATTDDSEPAAHDAEGDATATTAGDEDAAQPANEDLKTDPA